jgi:hypothetical protein
MCRRCVEGSCLGLLSLNLQVHHMRQGRWGRAGQTMNTCPRLSLLQLSTVIITIETKGLDFAVGLHMQVEIRSNI